MFFSNDLRATYQTIQHCPIYLDCLKLENCEEFLAMTKTSRHLHHPWIYPPLSKSEFRLYQKRLQRSDHRNFILRLKTTGAIVGIVNLNNIVWEGQASASLGYYVNQAFTKRGYMAQGLRLVQYQAFKKMGLHRLEAHIQPDNLSSLRLLESLGFTFDDLVIKFLFINGSWRNHERWTLINQESH